jgi:predicted membrane-bound spermidine synthase
LAGILDVGATIALGHAAWSFVQLESMVGKLAWVLPFLLVGVPAFVMGGTLPVAVRAMREEGVAAARAGGALYAANTAGGIAGALLASFVLLGWLGMRGTGMAACLMNFVAAGMALWLARGAPGQSSGNAPRVTAVVVESRMALALYAVAGGVALGYEVVWSQAVGQFVSTRALRFRLCWPCIWRAWRWEVGFPRALRGGCATGGAPSER